MSFKRQNSRQAAGNLEPSVTRYTLRHSPPSHAESAGGASTAGAGTSKVMAYSAGGGQPTPIMVMGLDDTPTGADQQGDAEWRKSVISINREKVRSISSRAKPSDPSSPADTRDTKNDLVAGYMASPPQAPSSGGVGQPASKGSQRKLGGSGTQQPGVLGENVLADFEQDLALIANGTSTKEERMNALNRIAKRTRSQQDRKELLWGGLVESLNVSLQEVETIPAAIMALLAVVTDPDITDHQYWDDTPDAYPHMLRLEIEQHNIIERLVALLCWSLLSDRLKGEIARILLNLSKHGPMADRVMHQDGALRALAVLLDSSNEGCASLAAAALANISYWSTEGPRLMARLQVLCAV